MSGLATGRRARTPALVAIVAPLLALAGVGSPAAAQQPDDPAEILGVEATPVGALPPIALPMPASRNHNYWTFRLQSGLRQGREGPDLLAVAGGIDLQWRGGSIFGITGGYQMRDCPAGIECDDGHPFFGTRARFNVVTGGPTLASLVGDYSATSTLGAEIGFGYAPGAAADVDVCTFDMGIPVSIAMLQTVRLTPFVMPSVAWDVDCGSGASPSHTDLLLNAGVGVQQLGLPGLDVYLGIQKVFRSGTGYQFGLTVVYVNLP